MAKFFLEPKLNSLLKPGGKPPLVEITFLGTGGAFDSKEKNSSAIIKTAAATILVDCGSTVYSELKSKNFVDSIEYVFVTHSHEDHIGSLSTLIYHKYFMQGKSVKIECIDSLKKRVNSYLVNICNHPKESFSINSNDGVLYKELNMIIHKIETTGLHCKGFPTGGFVFNFRKSGEDIFIIYSGDVNIPITDVIKDKDLKLYESLLKCPQNVFIFHESTAMSYPPGYPHCEYQKLDAMADIFPNVYVYHHGKGETDIINKDFIETRRKLGAIKTAIDFDLNKKLPLVGRYELKEKLRIQAKKLKASFDEEFDNVQPKTQDLNIFGRELIIQETKL